MADDPASLLSDPCWLAHRYVESTHSVRFVRVERAVHSEVPFLIDLYIGDRPVSADIPIAACVTETTAPLHFLFHSAFCSSTMLTRALDLPGKAMGLSEPTILNDLVGFRRRGGSATLLTVAADAALNLLARPFAPNEAVVVKPSNVVNAIAPQLMQMREASRALFLFAPLETFLVSVVRKGLPCRLWVRELLEGQLRDGFISFGFSMEEYFRMTDLQIAAVGWLAQHASFAQLARAMPDRLCSLDADCMAADPPVAIAAVAGYFGIELESDAVAALAASPVLTRHSKSGMAYSYQQRTKDYHAAHQAHADEIEKVLIWAQQVAAQVGLSLGPPAKPLIKGS